MEELIGTLLTHEIILNKTNEDTKGKKTLVLKQMKKLNLVKRKKRIKQPFY